MKLKNFCIMLDRAKVAYTIETNDDETKQCICISSDYQGNGTYYADFTFDMEGNLLAVNVGE